MKTLPPVLLLLLVGKGEVTYPLPPPHCREGVNCPHLPTCLFQAREWCEPQASKAQS
uniref:Uncharacterized protein n=1 Tax=Candidatus Kentrum sp. MB TaxID=2138164 RepID=A0A450XQZ5_9GAMM|nr:MAG: hypothetical protein BECKMB1821G_GA0114241_101423 [Candidatus Kentron sp. MB]VFK31712.1 MAG: hypothetical protein BECKMB1821I_GA0114274_102625 [Candidatus Kentron sp. MB]VFK75625.1 MAG: hypothetical protein BECKMB1821H_GA0114242_102724 [Candidatus Kentron sp. MB]